MSFDEINILNSSIGSTKHKVTSVLITEIDLAFAKTTTPSLINSLVPATAAPTGPLQHVPVLHTPAI
jgi:hypothetical protein